MSGPDVCEDGHIPWLSHQWERKVPREKFVILKNQDYVDMNNEITRLREQNDMLRAQLNASRP
jgi:hypothetical protein